MRILLIEDDQYTSEFLAATLSAHRYAVDAVADGSAGLELAAQSSYDLILLDVLIPKCDGIEVCRRLRAQGCQTPILMLTTQDSNEDVITGLDAGADDYVAKSCDSSQLLARMRALLRRGGNVTSTPVLTWGPLCLNPALAQVTYNQKEIALRPKEYSLLELFLRHPQRVLSRSCIIDHLWSIEETPVEGVVTNLIKDLRQRLKAAGMTTDLIETVYGLGYRLKTAPAQAEEPSGQEDVTSEALAAAWNDAHSKVRTQRGITAIQQIKQRFQASLDQRIAALETVERLLQAGNLNLEQWQAMQTEVHKLAGGLGTFGYGKASEVAHAMERLLDTTVNQNPRLASQFAQLLAELKQELVQSLTDKPLVNSSITRN
jgi:DNA-binding response OmpR family regulator/HPt (histidine-containing phosphotransfer) domain-containing protein